MIRIAFQLILSLSIVQDRPKKINIYVMDKDIYTGHQLTYGSMKSGSIFESITDDTLYYKLYSLAINLNHQAGINKQSIDPRMIIELVDGDSIITISISQVNLIAINGSHIIRAKTDSIIGPIRDHIPPTYHWYVPTEAELKKYIFPRTKLLLDSLSKNRKEPIKKRTKKKPSAVPQ